MWIIFSCVYQNFIFTHHFKINNFSNSHFLFLNNRSNLHILFLVFFLFLFFSSLHSTRSLSHICRHTSTTTTTTFLFLLLLLFLFFLSIFLIIFNKFLSSCILLLLMHQPLIFSFSKRIVPHIIIIIIQIIFYLFPRTSS